ncbi:MAG TPA: translation initiation factor IF-2 N-terminal domain-containing protein [Candidatus Limnocylindrales bacterium]|nr:translation initiation factor IF-2 N-terminal domain-containing protein [Candidatus Limnocylindrales bacterium]
MPERIRVNELARELEVKASFLLETLQKMGVTRKLTHSSPIEVELAEKLRLRLGAEQPPMRAPDATSVLEFLPESTVELELEPDTNARLSSLAEEVSAFRGKGALEPMAARKLGEYFRLQHIYHSTGIEGNRLSLRETEVVLLEGVELGDKPIADQIEVKDLAAAFRFLEQCAQQDEPLREIDVRELHRLTVGQKPETQPGAYRHAGVVITGSDLKPPEPLAVPGLMQQFVAWINRPKQLDTFAFAVIAHHKMTAIHPFMDGNGRVARLLLNLVLVRAGYPVVNIRREDRPRYYEALTFADVGLYSALISLALDRSLEVFSEMKRVREETDRMKLWADKLGQKEAEVAQRREEREYRIWLSSFETVRLEFQSRAEVLADELDSVEISFKAYPAPDFSKYILLRDKGRAPQTWFFSLRFHNNDGNTQHFFFRFYRDYYIHHANREIIPLQLNWFVNGEEAPVDNPAIRLRELWIDKEKGLFVRKLEAGKLVSIAEPSTSRVAEQFFEDVLKVCFGIG